MNFLSLCFKIKFKQDRKKEKKRKTTKNKWIYGLII